MTATINLHRKPDFELDGFLSEPEQAGKKVLCDCRIWLPKDASEDAWIELSVPASPEIPLVIGAGPLLLEGKVSD